MMRIMKKGFEASFLVVLVVAIALALFLLIGFVKKGIPEEYRTLGGIKDESKGFWDWVTGQKEKKMVAEIDKEFVEVFSKVFDNIQLCMRNVDEFCYCDLVILGHDGGFYSEGFKEGYGIGIGKRNSGGFFVTPLKSGEEEGVYPVGNAKVLEGNGTCIYEGERNIKFVDSMKLYRDGDELVLESAAGNFNLAGPVRMVKFGRFRDKACFVHPDYVNDRALPRVSCQSQQGPAAGEPTKDRTEDGTELGMGVTS